MNLPSWSQTDDQRPTADIKAKSKNHTLYGTFKRWLTIFEVTDMNAKSKKRGWKCLRVGTFAFMSVTHKIAFEGKIEVKWWKCLHENLYEVKCVNRYVYISILRSFWAVIVIFWQLYPPPLTHGLVTDRPRWTTGAVGRVGYPLKGTPYLIEVPGETDMLQGWPTWKYT